MTGLNGLVVMTPTSIASTGTGNSSSINADGSVDFASCATLSLNGVFTSSYDNYMIVVRCKSSDEAGFIGYRLRASGTDASGSNYVVQRIQADSITVSASRSTLTRGAFVSVDDTESGGTAYIFGPYLAQPTASRGVSASAYLGAYVSEWAATHSLSTSYDGITLSNGFGTATLSGLVTVFGFNQ